VILRSDKLEGKKARYFMLLFCDSAFASLAAETVPDTPAGKLLRVLFHWPTVEAPQVPAPEPEAQPQTFTTVRAPSGAMLIRNASEVWRAVKLTNAWVPEWVTGGREESSQRPNPLAPLEEPPRIPLSRTYGDSRLKTLLDAQGRRRGIW
jgi:hypothetical protein